jgi:hypothetical protein
MKQTVETLHGEVRNVMSHWISQSSKGINQVSSNTLKPMRGSGRWMSGSMSC